MGRNVTVQKVLITGGWREGTQKAIPASLSSIFSPGYDSHPWYNSLPGNTENGWSDFFSFHGICLIEMSSSSWSTAGLGTEKGGMVAGDSQEDLSLCRQGSSMSSICSVQLTKVAYRAFRGLTRPSDTYRDDKKTNFRVQGDLGGAPLAPSAA